MAPVTTVPGFTLPRARIEPNEGVIDPAVVFAEGLGVLRQAFTELAAAIPAPAAKV